MTNGILSWYRKTTESEVQKYEDVFLYKCRVSGFSSTVIVLLIIGDMDSAFCHSFSDNHQQIIYYIWK